MFLNALWLDFVCLSFENLDLWIKFDLKNILSYVNLSAEGDRFVVGGESTRIDRQNDGAVPRADKFT